MTGECLQAYFGVVKGLNMCVSGGSFVTEQINMDRYYLCKL